jgi:hypothetical protein
LATAWLLALVLDSTVLLNSTLRAQSAVLVQLTWALDR